MLSDLQMLQGLFGNTFGGGASGVSLLGNFASQAPGNLFSLLGGQPVAGTQAAAPTFGILPGGGVGAMPVAAGAPTGPPLDPLARANQAGALMNQNAFGTSDPTKLGMLGAAGFPLFNDPRMIQGFLGTMAMNGDDAAAEQLRRMLQGGFFGGMGGMGAFGGEGNQAGDHAGDPEGPSGSAGEG